MTRAWTLRRAHQGDALTVAGHRYPGAEPHGEAVRAYAAWVAGAVARGSYLGWLAEVESVVVAGAGLVLLEWGPTRTDPSPLRGRVVNVYTDPAWRRRGLATALLERCLREAEALGIGVLGLGTTPQARALYERFGFKASTTEMYRVAEDDKP